MTLMQVVLPDPLGPTRPRISPAPTEKLKTSSARKPPKRFTSPSTTSNGAASGDIDAPSLQQRDQAVRQKHHQAHDQQAVNELKVLWRGNSDGVVNAVENDSAENRPGYCRAAAEQNKHDGEDRELDAENGLGIKHRHVPGKDAAGEAGDQRAQQPGNDALAHHVDARHAGADRVLANGFERHAEMRITKINDEGERGRENSKRRGVAECRIKYAAQADAI